MRRQQMHPSAVRRLVEQRKKKACKECTQREKIEKIKASLQEIEERVDAISPWRDE